MSIAFNGRHVGKRREYLPRHCSCRRCRLAAALTEIIPWHKTRHVTETTVRA